jgi:1-deoxy-D-xylulose-5-phosphate reductoisomerase
MYPERAPSPVPRMDWTEARSWTFAPPDLDKFPLLKLAYRAQETGGSATCTLNAADEIAVEAFLEGRISYPAIAEMVEGTLSRMPVREARSVGEVLEIDGESRTVARGLVKERAEATLART